MQVSLQWVGWFENSAQLSFWMLFTRRMVKVCGTNPPLSIKAAVHLSTLSRTHLESLKRHYAAICCCCIAASLRIVDAQRYAPPALDVRLVRGCSFRVKDPRRRIEAPPMPWHDLLPGPPSWPSMICATEGASQRDFVFFDIKLDDTVMLDNSRSRWREALSKTPHHGKIVLCNSRTFPLAAVDVVC